MSSSRVLMRHIFHGLAVTFQLVMIILKQQHICCQHSVSVCQLRNVSDELKCVEISLVPEVAPRKSAHRKHIFHCTLDDGMLLALSLDTATEATFYECLFFFCASTHHVVEWLQCKHGCKHAGLFSPSHARVNLSRLLTA